MEARNARPGPSRASANGHPRRGSLSTDEFDETSRFPRGDDTAELAAAEDAFLAM
jgi:hypothetical protein